MSYRLQRLPCWPRKPDNCSRAEWGWVPPVCAYSTIQAPAPRDNLTHKHPHPVHDHQGCINHALAEAERLCESRAVRFTALRRKVLELIWSNHESVKAYDLLDALRHFDASAKPATVYRALDFLLEQGLIHRVESLNAFVGCRQPGGRHELLLLICDRCHTVDERVAPELMAAAVSEIRTAAFHARRQSFEIHGLCADCAGLDESFAK